MLKIEIVVKREIRLHNCVVLSVIKWWYKILPKYSWLCITTKTSSVEPY